MDQNEIFDCIEKDYNNFSRIKNKIATIKIINTCNGEICNIYEIVLLNNNNDKIVELSHFFHNENPTFINDSTHLFRININDYYITNNDEIEGELPHENDYFINSNEMDYIKTVSLEIILEEKERLIERERFLIECLEKEDLSDIERSDYEKQLKHHKIHRKDIELFYDGKEYSEYSKNDIKNKK